MRLRNQILSLLLACLLACLLLAGMALPAMAADSTGFSDVPPGIWYAEAVAWCRENGIMRGTTESAFSPDMPMSRAMLAAVLWNIEGSPAVDGTADFSDVEEDRWYTEAVRWAISEGIMGGYGGGQFGTEDPVTREQLATVLWQYAGSPAAASGEAFADESEISPFAVSAVHWAKAENIISGVGENRFAPKGGATRAQVAVILYQYLAPKTSAGGDTDDTGDSAEPGNPPKVLVAYFSRTGENYSVGSISEGNTAVIAKMIAEETGADLFEIRPVTPYPDDYQEMLTVARQEAAEDARPQIAGTVSDMAAYDIVFIGYPIWNANLPQILYTFLESYDFTGKTVIPFNTHEGSGQAGTQRTIASILTGSTVLDGLAVRGSTAQNERDTARETVRTWLDGLDLDLKASQDSAAETGVFDLEHGTVLLNSSYTMPILGIGTYTLSQSQAENSVYWALKAGFRLIDTARIYGNEEGVGRGIQQAIDEGIVTRDEIFVTTKMWTADYKTVKVP